jgi:hypothetical protein
MQETNRSRGNCLAWFTFQSCRWIQYVHLKHQATSELYSITIHNTGLSIVKTLQHKLWEVNPLSTFLLPP